MRVTRSRLLVLVSALALLGISIPASNVVAVRTPSGGARYVPPAQPVVRPLRPSHTAITQHSFTHPKRRHV